MPQNKKTALVYYICIRDIKMISFRHKSNTKQIKIKSKRDLNERMSPWLQGIFGIKNPIVGFKTANNKYYDTQTFFNNKQKFYGQVVDIIQAKDQLEISFVSDNLNSSSNIRQPANPLFTQDFQQEPEDVFKLISDVKSMERRLQENKELSILFNINQIYKNQIVESMTMIKSQQPNKIFFFVRILSSKTTEFPHYCIYVGKKLVATLNLTREYKENILMVIERHSTKLLKNDHDKDERQEREQHFRVSYDQQNEAPSFTTYQLQERLNQEACQDYLLKMYQEKFLKKYEYLKLKQKCDQNFIEFYRIFCEGAIDNDYENFKNQIRAKVDNNLELLLSNVDQMDLSRPISREEQRKQNLKKSVSNIEIVKVQNYFEILDQLKPLLPPLTLNLIKNQLLDENQVVFSAFSDFLSRKISKQDLACFLERAVERKQQRPISRCLPRSANRNKDRQIAYNSEDEIFSVPPSNQKQTNSQNDVYNKRKSSIPKQEEASVQKEEAQPIKLMSLGSGSDAKENKIEKMDSKENKQTPPMFGSSKEENNFSPIKYMSDIESNYKQAWNRLESKADFFEPEEFGLLYYYLESRDDSISNHIQQLEWNEQSSLEKLKSFLENKMIKIMEQNFTPMELDVIASNRNSERIQCIYLNFKFESDLVKFLQAMHAEVSIMVSQSASPSPTLSHQLVVNKNQSLNKKASDSNLLSKNKKQQRKYSDEHKEIHSPKQSSFSHPRTNQMTGGVYLQILNQFWNEQFQEMLEHCSYTEDYKEQYLREAFSQGNPSVYAWINAFVRGKYAKIDSTQLRNSLKIKEQQNKYVMRVVPIFSQVLKSFQEEGKISDRMRKWCVVELMELNMVVIGSFECYIKTKNQEQFVQNISLAYELQNSEMEYFRSYFHRIQNLLKQMSGQDEISIQVFRLYPKHIKAICELYFITGDIDELLDNLDCLHQVEKKRRSIKMATLNFSGCNLSPFEYHDGSEEIKRISQYMQEIIETQQQALNQQLFVIDKYYQNNKYSVRFGDKVCETQFLVNRKEYCRKWRAYYDKEKPQSIDAKEQTIEATMLFDYYCYLSLVRYLYGKNWNVSDEIDREFKQTNKCYQIQGIQKLESKKLKEFLNIKLNRPASNIEKKYQLTMDYFLRNKLDIFFLQEADGVKWEEQLIHQYGWVKGNGSVILFRKEKFGAPKTNLHEKYKDKLNFNNDSTFYFGDRGYLLLSIHLKSNMQINIQQAEQMFKVLEEIYDEHPMIKIIIGMDANHFIGGSAFNFLNFAPKTKEECTTVKMRTTLQVQFKKSKELSKMGKDYILTNLDIKSYQIEKINGELLSGNELLPSDQHPYDHFVVTATI